MLGMSRAWRDRLAAVSLAMVVAGVSPAPAMEWPPHGSFAASESEDIKGLVGCALNVMQATDDWTFILHLWQSPGDVMMTFFVLQDRGSPPMGAMTVVLDGREILAFTEVTPLKDGLAKGVHVFGVGADRAFVRMLQDASAGAHSLEVVTGSERRSIPVSELKEAVADFVACRSAKRS